MHTRPVQPADFSATADIAVDCFWDDELFAFTNPHKGAYPHHFRDFFLRRHRMRYWSPDMVFHVAVTDQGDDGHEDGGRVVGYAVWHRVGAGAGTGTWGRQGVLGYLERTLLSLTESYYHHTRADKSLDNARLEEWLHAHHDEFAAIPELWKLQNLCVSPAFQRRGVGGMLMQWGKEQAQEEGIPIGLSSSTQGQALYLRQGFKRYGTIRVEGFPVAEVPVLLWEPNVVGGSPI